MNNFNKEQIEAFITNRQYIAAICAFADMHKMPASELAAFIELILNAEKSSYFYPKV
jgi:hypothetical protein